MKQLVNFIGFKCISFINGRLAVSLVCPDFITGYAAATGCCVSDMPIQPVKFNSD